MIVQILLVLLFSILAILCKGDLVFRSKTQAPITWKDIFVVIFFAESLTSFVKLIENDTAFYPFIQSSFGFEKTHLLEIIILVFLSLIWSITFVALVYFCREKSWFDLKRNQPV